MNDLVVWLCGVVTGIAATAAVRIILYKPPFTDEAQVKRD